MSAAPVLEELLDGLRLGRAPQRWAQARPTIEREAVELASLVDAGQVVYGTTTLPGHRDGEQASADRVIADLLESHTIGGRPYLSQDETRHVTYVKLYTLAAGGTGISPACFDLLARLATHPDFFPKVPRRASYSAGDVIPGAHWACAALAAEPRHRPPTDGMALVNGGFVHIAGLTAAIGHLQRSLALFLEVTRLRHAIEPIDADVFLSEASAPSPTARSWVGHVAAPSAGPGPARQTSVSVRATPQVVELLADAAADLVDDLDTALQRPSGNPLVWGDPARVVSQASFLAPGLTLRSSAVIDSLMFAMWAIVGRTNHLLSGDVAGIPRDGALPEAPLGQIQVPKLLTAHVEDARLRLGVRPFATGGDTSYGIEDLWTHGRSLVDLLEDALDALVEATIVELRLLAWIGERHETSLGPSPLLGWAAGADDNADLVDAVRSGRGLPDLPALALDLLALGRGRS